MSDYNWFPNVPFGVSEMKPSEFKTAANMTPEELAIGREAALGENYSTSKWDRCQRCGNYYRDEMPSCPNFREHGIKPTAKEESERQMEEVQA